MEKKYNFDHSYQIFDPGGAIWASGGLDIRTRFFFSFKDGLKMNDEVGAGVVGPEMNKSITTGRWPRVFLAEVQALLECSTICSRRKRQQHALKSLFGNVFNHFKNCLVVIRTIYIWFLVIAKLRKTKEPRR